MSAYEPPPPPEARGLRLGDLVRRRPVSDPDDEEPAFPASRGDVRAAEPARGSRSPRGAEQESSWRAELKQRRQRQEASDREAAAERRAAAERADAERARRGAEREAAKGPRPERSARSETAGAQTPNKRRTDAQRAEGGVDGATAQRPGRPTVRHVMKPRDPGKLNAPAPAVEPARKKPWRKVTKSASGTAAAGAGGGASAGTGAAPAESPSWYSRRMRASAAGADSGASGGGSGIPQVQPPYPGGGGGDAGPSRGPFSGIDLIMLIPAAIAAWYGAQMFILCAHEAGFRASFFLWLMMGFWIVIVSAKWPLLRLMRWAWVLAGLMAAASIPIGGG
jgi:hypothetical protein